MCPRKRDFFRKKKLKLREGTEKGTVERKKGLGKKRKFHVGKKVSPGGETPYSMESD